MSSSLGQLPSSSSSSSKTTKTTFTINLQRRVEPGLSSCGKFDGSHACLVAATSSGNVLVHSPHREPPQDNLVPESSSLTSQQQRQQEDARLKWTGELAELQIGREVTALVTGRLSHFKVYPFFFTNRETNSMFFYNVVSLLFRKSDITRVCFFNTFFVGFFILFLPNRVFLKSSFLFFRKFDILQ